MDPLSIGILCLFGLAALHAGTIMHEDRQITERRKADIERRWASKPPVEPIEDL